MYDKPIIQAFQRTGIWFNDAEEAKRIQVAAHTLGFRWAYQRPYRQRSILNLTGSGYIYINKDYEMSWSRTNLTACDQRTLSNIEYTAAEFKLWRKDVSKATKKRGAKRKWELTSVKNPGYHPFEGNVLVAVQLANGEIRSGRSDTFDWSIGFGESDIVRYKSQRPNFHRPPGKQKPEETKIVSLEAMVEGVAWDLGKGVAIPVHDFEASAAAADVTDVRDTNPKRQYGVASIPLNLWSPLASAYGAVSLYNGSLKYGRGNYKGTPVEASIYIAAAMRHLLAWAEGEEFDPADGCPNLGGVLANIAILLDARAVGTLIDDREISGGYLKEREKLKAIVKQLQELHAGKDPRHYSIADNRKE